MKVTKHVEQLLRQGRKPQELVALGFSKQVVTRVRRQLREEKTASQSGTQMGKDGTESYSPLAVTLPAATAPIDLKLRSLETRVGQLESRLEVLEGLGVELLDMQDRLAATPVLGLEQDFTCDCGASGYVAVHIQCTKCGRDTYWGCWPDEK